MSSIPTAPSLRKLIARRDGYRCHYCGVPSAATLEHVHPVSEGGRSGAENLVLACPYCNQRKSTSPADDFKQSGAWQIDPLLSVPENIFDLLIEEFGWEHKKGFVYTGSHHAKLEIESNTVFIHVRADKTDKWRIVKLGCVDSQRVIAASYEFLRRHFTPSKPKKRMVNRKLKRANGHQNHHFMQCRVT